MMLIDLEKKIRTYQGNQTLQVNTCIPLQSITKIYGPSGCGKTTLLKIIAGLLKPEKGKIEFNGQLWLDTHQSFCLPVQQRRLGFVFQNYALFPNLTVRQHLLYATKDAAWIDRLLNIVQLNNLQQHKPEHLSGGQQQRLSIIRALAIKPQLLLMDEPFSALDPEMRAEVVSQLKPLITELKITCLIVSHNPAELEGIVDNEIKIG
jgi:molybdate transport system ATP-binding protein